ncbi:glutamate/gamma-aminobutyrate family transporter YjeM [Vagococcus zengguangii]|uniref:Glutamate/gamma-aminobutyrate family transporter YjeM n=1 Tax=Vagococcus zengguangii TaxID=2571750 RepID=A0A4D7CTH9_9ENTE|nr:glutamate/gamma-aminobutyrate family transporter YjeM [Vagococcus zengguangii]QCI85757.1 glutamate/gamma-aminobutyrate family transporter YjeM [Vagococcus zengguangii]TLG81698.1 glutamate/gamma-aminobutyrate family transporter YjeM [Vagococcus zengguangii]
MAKKKLTLVTLILMIFTSVFGFTNIPRAYYLMGYASIPWYILAALTFFLPFAFMLAEFGAAFKNSKGGIYSWMAESISPKFAFVGTFMWYASFIIWMVNVGSGIWIPLSNFIFGVDKTQSWSLFGLNGVQTLGVLAILWILLITIVSSKGLDKVKKVTSVGGTAIALLNVLLIVGGLIILALNGGEMLQPVSAKAFISSPNESYQSMISIFSFLVFAIFAFGGIEAVGGLVDQTENAEVTFPKAVTISAIVIAVGYAIGIFIVGSFTNWTFAYTQFSEAETTLGNVAYITMNNMGYQLGLALNLSDATAMTIGNWFSRYMGLSMFLALSGAFFTLIFSPLKQIIEGTPSEIWPAKWSQTKNDMPTYAMWIQALIVSVIIAFVSFGGDSAAKFFQILTAMTNVSMTIPNMFLAIAFIGFKNNQTINKPFEMYKSTGKAKAAAYMVIFVVGFANVFTIINPAMNGNLSETIWSIVGPVFFSVVALILFGNYEKKQQLK